MQPSSVTDRILDSVVGLNYFINSKFPLAYTHYLTYQKINCTAADYVIARKTIPVKWEIIGAGYT